MNLTGIPYQRRRILYLFFMFFLGCYDWNSKLKKRIEGSLMSKSDVIIFGLDNHNNIYRICVLLVIFACTLILKRDEW